MSGQAPDEHIQAMLDEIERTGRIHAQAKRYMLALKDQKEIALASVMKILENEGIGALAKQRREALLHPQYAAVLAKYHASIEDEIIARTIAENAGRLFESWRTESANFRAAR